MTNEETPCCPCKCKQKKPAWKRLVGLALAAFAAIAALRAFNSASEAPPQKAEAEAPVESRKLTVFYFHGRQRCMTCNRTARMLDALAAFERWSKRITAAICLAAGIYFAT